MLSCLFNREVDEGGGPDLFTAPHEAFRVLPCVARLSFEVDEIHHLGIATPGNFSCQAARMGHDKQLGFRGDITDQLRQRPHQAGVQTGFRLVQYEKGWGFRCE